MSISRKMAEAPPHQKQRGDRETRSNEAQWRNYGPAVVSYGSSGPALSFTFGVKYFCVPQPTGRTPAANPATTHRGAQTLGIIEAIKHLWPTGFQVGLRAGDRNNQIREWLRTNGHSIPQALERAIQRALVELRRDPAWPCR